MTAPDLDARLAELRRRHLQGGLCEWCWQDPCDTAVALGRVAELEAERDRLRKLINDTRRVPEGSERAALWTRADRNRGSKPWRTVWHLLRALETAEAERDAARAETQRLREQAQ